MKATTPVIEYEIATSNRRLGARLIDLVVAFIALNFVLILVVGALTALLHLDSDLAMWLFIGVSLLSLVLYDTLMVRLWGKTLGKMALGLRVVDLKGERPTWGMCLLRALMLYLCGIGVVAATAITASLFGWIFMAGLAKYKRFPQDSLTRTFVVRETKGQLVKAETAGGTSPGPLSDLDRLYEQGMISKEEWERKKNEAGRQ